MPVQAPLPAMLPETTSFFTAAATVRPSQGQRSLRTGSFADRTVSRATLPPQRQGATPAPQSAPRAGASPPGSTTRKAITRRRGIGKRDSAICMGPPVRIMVEQLRSRKARTPFTDPG